jgi:hypothetical protein
MASPLWALMAHQMMEALGRDRPDLLEVLIGPIGKLREELSGTGLAVERERELATIAVAAAAMLRQKGL